MSNEPKGTDRLASTRHHLRKGTPRRIWSRTRDRVRQMLDGGLRHPPRLRRRRGRERDRVDHLVDPAALTRRTR